VENFGYDPHEFLSWLRDHPGGSPEEFYASKYVDPHDRETGEFHRAPPYYGFRGSRHLMSSGMPDSSAARAGRTPNAGILWTHGNRCRRRAR
jgi:hypothetical protein